MEVALRFFLGNNAMGSLLQIEWQRDQRVRLIPEKSVVHTGIREKITPVTHRVNRFGYVGKLRSPKKPEGIYRIIIVGDSFSFCPGISWENSYPARLEHHLKGHFNSVEVLNFGIPSHNLEDLLLHFEDEALSFDPDLIIIQIAANDFFPSISTIFKKLGKIQANWINRSYLIRSLFTLSWLQFEENTDSFEGKRMRFSNFIKKLKTISRNHGIKSLVISFGDPFQKKNEIVKKLLFKNGIPFFPLPEKIRPHLKHDLGHLNVWGADLYATALANWLIKISAIP